MSYYNYEIGHILARGPEHMDELTPRDMLGAVRLFDALYRPGDG